MQQENPLPAGLGDNGLRCNADAAQWVENVDADGDGTVGDYGGFKELAEPDSYHFTGYPAPEENPDSRRRSPQSNAALRWECRPGSTLFLVWSQSRADSSSDPSFRPFRHFGRSFADEGTNIFLIKLNYWMGL